LGQWRESLFDIPGLVSGSMFFVLKSKKALSPFKEKEDEFNFGTRIGNGGGIKFVNSEKGNHFPPFF
jgi:hypothetical protein